MKVISILLIFIVFISGCANKVPGGNPPSATPLEFPIQQNETIPKEQQTELIQTNKSDMLKVENTSKINETVSNITISKSNESIAQINATVNVSVNKTIQMNQTMNKSNQSNTSTSVILDKFIVANPFDLSQASTISKFRSCVGHDYSGFNAEGQKEKQRSMKHYIDGISSVVGYSDKVKVFAPFDGKIVFIDDDFASFEGKQRGQQIWVQGPSSGDWVLVFFHVDLLKPIKKGSEVKAGQHIGYANLDGSPNFDFTLKKFGVFGPNTIESPFLHMSEDALKQYKNKGLKFDDFIISKSVRDSNLCECTNEYCAFPSNGPTSNPEDWIIIN